MPFIDFHKLEGITVEDLKNAQIADHTARDKYGFSSCSFIMVDFFDQALITIEQLSIESLSAIFSLERSTIVDQDARTSYFEPRTYSTTTLLKETDFQCVSSLN